VVQLYPLVLGSLFVASYDSQGLHTTVHFGLLFRVFLLHMQVIFVIVLFFFRRLRVLLHSHYSFLYIVSDF
jgi:hypothetical protein